MTHQHHTSHTRRTSRITKPALVILAFATAMTAPSVASADVVTDWNQTMIEVLANTPPPPSARVGAIVQSSVFDAANGIEPHYTPVHVTPAGPRGASRAAAAAGAAHEALVALFPGDKTMLDQRLAQTLAQIPADSSIAHGSISRGCSGDRPSPTRSLPGARQTASRSRRHPTFSRAYPDVGHRLRRRSASRSSGNSPR